MLEYNLRKKEKTSTPKITPEKTGKNALFFTDTP